MFNGDGGGLCRKGGGEAANQNVAEGEPLLFYKKDKTIVIKRVSNITVLTVSYNVI